MSPKFRRLCMFFNMDDTSDDQCFSSVLDNLTEIQAEITTWSDVAMDKHLHDICKAAKTSSILILLSLKDILGDSDTDETVSSWEEEKEVFNLFSLKTCCHCFYFRF